MYSAFQSVTIDSFFLIAPTLVKTHPIFYYPNGQRISISFSIITRPNVGPTDFQAFFIRHRLQREITVLIS